MFKSVILNWWGHGEIAVGSQTNLSSLLKAQIFRTAHQHRVLHQQNQNMDIFL